MNLPEYTREEVARHNTIADYWTIIKGSVYHLDTEFITSIHPGKLFVMEAAGKDGTILFEDRNHSDFAIQALEDYKVGVLKE